VCWSGPLAGILQCTRHPDPEGSALLEEDGGVSLRRGGASRGPCRRTAMRRQLLPSMWFTGEGGVARKVFRLGTSTSSRAGLSSAFGFGPIA